MISGCFVLLYVGFCSLFSLWFILDNFDFENTSSFASPAISSEHQVNITYFKKFYQASKLGLWWEAGSVCYLFQWPMLSFCQILELARTTVGDPEALLPSDALLGLLGFPPEPSSPQPSGHWSLDSLGQARCNILVGAMWCFFYVMGQQHSPNLHYLYSFGIGLLLLMDNKSHCTMEMFPL